MGQHYVFGVCAIHWVKSRHKKMVGVRGFEPPASASRTQRSIQAEPHGAAEPEQSDGTPDQANVLPKG